MKNVYLQISYKINEIKLYYYLQRIIWAYTSMIMGIVTDD